MSFKAGQSRGVWLSFRVASMSPCENAPSRFGGWVAALPLPARCREPYRRVVPEKPVGACLRSACSHFDSALRTGKSTELCKNMTACGEPAESLPCNPPPFAFPAGAGNRAGRHPAPYTLLCVVQRGRIVCRTAHFFGARAWASIRPDFSSSLPAGSHTPLLRRSPSFFSRRSVAAAQAFLSVSWGMGGVRPPPRGGGPALPIFSPGGAGEGKTHSVKLEKER